MSAKKEQTPSPLVANGHPRSDEELVTAQSTGQTKKKRVKCIALIVAFTVFQIGIILLFVFIVMHFKNPKFRVRSGSSFNNDTFIIGRKMAAPSFNLTMNIQFGVKNPNFGHFKYEMSTVTFTYRGIVVGDVNVDKARTRARSTKKINAMIVLKTETTLHDNSDELNSDISAGRLPLTSYSKLDGKIHLMKLVKKKKYAQMNCSMNVDIQTRTLQDILCK